MIVKEPRQFADGHAVPHGNGELPHEALVAGVEHRAFDRGAADGIGAVADDHLDAVTCAGAQAVGHRVDVGVDARADILQVDDKHIDVGQHLAHGFARVAVERVDGNAPHGVARMRGLDHVVLHVRAETVLGPEEGRDRHAAHRHEAVDDMDELVVDRGGIRDDANPAPPQARGRQQMRGPERDRHVAIIPA